MLSAWTKRFIRGEKFYPQEKNFKFIHGNKRFRHGGNVLDVIALSAENECVLDAEKTFYAWRKA